MSSPVPELGVISAEQFRQRLAGLIDPQETVDADTKEGVRDLAVRFCAALPAVFGDSLDRTTLWDRIGSGIQSAAAKTAGDDAEYFVSQVLEHIKTDPAKALSEPEIAHVLLSLQGWSVASRQAWLLHLSTHLIPTLVFAKAKWEQRKADAKAKTNGKPKRKPKFDHEPAAAFVEQE